MRLFGTPHQLPALVQSSMVLRGGGTANVVQQLMDLVETRPALGTGALLASYVCVELSGLPSTPMAIALGLTYPPAQAFGLALASSMFAAVLAFSIGRTVLRPRCLRKIRETRQLRAIDAAVKERGFVTILLLRLLVPLPPAVNYVYGATAARLLSYILATAVGNTPGTLLAVLSPRGTKIRLPWYGFVCLGLAVAALFYGAFLAGTSVQRKLDEYAALQD